MGINHFKVWTLTSTNLKSKEGFWDKNQCSRSISCIASNLDDYLCGASDGSFQIWKGNTLTLVKTDLHNKKSIECISNCGGYILTGGRDCRINILDKNYNPLLKVTEEQFVSKKELFSFCSEIKAAWLSQDSKLLIIGSVGGEIYELSTKDAKLNTSTKFSNPRRLMSSHYSPNKRSTNEVWGLTVYSNDNDLFATCGDDGSLRIWSI